jgi:hypothetical protein
MHIQIVARIHVEVCSRSIAVDYKSAEVEETKGNRTIEKML